MRVGIDAFPLRQRYGGIGNYVRNLLSALDRLDTTEEFIAYVPPGSTSDWNQITCIESKRLVLSWRKWLDSLDVYHGTNFKLQSSGRRGAVLTIHDLWLDRYPEYSKKLFGQRLSARRTCQRAWQADHLIAVSRYTAREIQDLYGVPEDRISVIYHGVSADFFLDLDEHRFATLRSRINLGSEPYILFVGGADPRKNHKTFFQAYSCHSDLYEKYCIVVVGNPHNRFGTLLGSSQSVNIRHRLVSVESVSTENLRLLYSHASLFVFPSRYEGFGMPLLEAMACGVPIVTSDRTALPEIVGDAAVLVNPDDAEALSHAMRRVLDDPDLQALMKKRGFERAQQFTWKQAAEQTLEVYRKVGARP